VEELFYPTDVPDARRLQERLPRLEVQLTLKEEPPQRHPQRQDPPDPPAQQQQQRDLWISSAASLPHLFTES
jgi:hypothetical protein